MKNKLIAIIVTGIIFNLWTPLSAQVSINTDGIPPDPSAILDLKSTTKGLIIPRMTQNQISEFVNLANGLLVFCTTDNKFYVYIESTNTWKEVLYGPGAITPTWTSCGSPFTDTRNGKFYHTIQIGTQCWFKENLNIGTLINGSMLQSDNSVIEKHCYNNLEENCDIYGGLYQWNEMMNYSNASNTNPSGIQGICPSGWHIPADAEWCQLETFLDPTINCSRNGYGGTDAGGKMKETGSSHWLIPNIGATNSSGFTALPGGLHNPPSFINSQTHGIFWSTTLDGPDMAFNRALFYDLATFSRGEMNSQVISTSVRCLKD
jgi:uncharacterized protein (TIGR02145 family)